MNNKKILGKVNKRDTMNYHVLESMDDLVRIVDLEGDIIYENEAMKLALKNRPQVKNQLNITDALNCVTEFSKNQRTSISREIIRGDKTYSAKSSPVFNDQGDVIAIVEVFRDITVETDIKIELFNANRKINDEIILARNIQRSILPRKTKFGNISFQYDYIPSGNLSGDIFDVIEIDDHRLGLYIADVVGHGISASIMTMFIRQTMRNILVEKRDISPSDTMNELKNRFNDLDLEESQYFTMLYALIDFRKQTMTYVNAGHNCSPIMFNDSNIGYLVNTGKFISNIFPAEDYKERVVDIIPGYKFLFYTDGLIETRNKEGKYYDEEHLKNWLFENRRQERIVDKLVNNLNTFRWLEQDDDVAILMMEIEE